jgi:atypical dual specificity phosphatase
MPSNYTVVIDGVLAGMERPGSSAPLVKDLEFLKEQGIGAIVSLTLEPLEPALVDEFGLRYLHLPIPDFAPPTMAQVRRFNEFLKSAEADGLATVVHCGAGHGRTGTMLACALVERGRKAEDAINELRMLRSGYIETREQEAVVFEVERTAQRGPHGA